MKRLQKYSALLEAVKASDPKTRVAILRSAPEEFIKTLLEVVLNFLAGNVTNEQKYIKKAKQYKSLLRNIEQRRHGSINSLRKSFLQQKGGFLPLLLAPIIAASVIPAIARKSARSATDAALDGVENRVKGYLKKL